MERTVFIGALNPTAAVTSKLRDWAAALWPDHVALGTSSPCQLWITADRGVLDHTFVETESRRTVVHGWIWDETGPGDDDVEWAPLDRLGDLLLTDPGWPLPRSWDGSFSCATFDPRTRALSLAVDPIGLRRLFYTRVGETLIFGSVQSACAWAAGLEPSPAHFAQWLGIGFTLGRDALFSGLIEVQAGERVRFRADGSWLDSVVDVPWHRQMESVSAEAGAERIVPLLKRYAHRFSHQLRPEKTAIALSGGMDSRLVLGGLGDWAQGLKTYTYGGADDHEVALAIRSAQAVGADPAVVALDGQFFPEQPAIRRRALLSEALVFPQWQHMDAAAERDGVHTLLMGDITNCMNVYIRPLRGRRERVERTLQRLTGRAGPLDQNPTSVEAWLEAEIAGATRRSVHMAHQLKLDVDAAEVARVVGDGFRQVAELLHVEGHSLFCLQEKFYLAIERLASGGAQIVCLDGTREVIPIYSARRVVEQGFNVDFESRTRRALLDAVARRLLPRKVRRLPTATIPWVSLDAPKWSQETAWLARWLADAGLRSLSKRWPRHWRRDRLFRTIALKPEYQHAIHLGYGDPWGISDFANTSYWASRVRRTAAGTRPTTIPIAETRALVADTMVAASVQGPDLLERLDDFPRT